MSIISNVLFTTAQTIPFGEELSVNIMPDINCLWGELTYTGRPSMRMSLLDDIAESQRMINKILDATAANVNLPQFKYQVVSSNTLGAFNYGGDLALFRECINSNNRALMSKYAKACIDVLYPMARGYNDRLLTISLVQGDALGGGFEAALANDIIVAEEGSRFGFPEMMFGMFPGMGAVSFLCKRIELSEAKKMIVNAEIYTVDEMYEKGVVDYVVPKGTGREKVYSLINEYNTREASHFGLKKAITRKFPITYSELIDITNIWVDTAMSISQNNMSMLEYILNEQLMKWEKN